eukprot:2675011-Rhodomonas_salina.1
MLRCPLSSAQTPSYLLLLLLLRPPQAPLSATRALYPVGKPPGLSSSISACPTASSPCFASACSFSPIFASCASAEPSATEWGGEA